MFSRFEVCHLNQLVEEAYIRSTLGQHLLCADQKMRQIFGNYPPCCSCLNWMPSMNYQQPHGRPRWITMQSFGGLQVDPNQSGRWLNEVGSRPMLPYLCTEANYVRRLGHHILRECIHRCNRQHVQHSRRNPSELGYHMH